MLVLKKALWVLGWGGGSCVESRGTKLSANADLIIVKNYVKGKNNEQPIYHIWATM